MSCVMPESGFSLATGAARLDNHALEKLFNETFLVAYNTRLQGGGEEPVYLPVSAGRPHNLIIYRHDYAASALHEVAHWCVAGRKRRLLEDFGYWYAADGRSEQQQREFERVEIRPQAMEWVFSVASARPFRVSADNLAAGLGASEAFKDAIYQQVMAFCHSGLPPRAGQFVTALSRLAQVAEPLDPGHYQRAAL